MLSWIFRHRERLATIYGMVQAPPLAGKRLETAEPPRIAPAGQRVRPGSLARRSRGVIELAPMPPRVR